MAIEKALTLQQLVEQQYGVKTDVAINTYSVGTTPINVLSNNPNRVGFLIVNLSSNQVYVNWENSVSSTNGIQLVNNGGVYSMNWKDDFNIVGYGMLAVATGASSTVFVAEIYTLAH